MLHQVSILLAVLAWGTAVSDLPAQQATAVVAELSDGRSYTGLIDSKTNTEALVLRFERGGAVLWRPIAWSEIESLTIGGKRFSAGELARRFKEFASEAKSKAERARLRSDSPAASEPEKPRLPAPKVIAISFDTLLANWDGDVEADGLVIHLQPSDQWQQLTAASGTLEVELYALQASAFHQRPNNRGRSVEPIGRWSQAVNLSDYTTRGATIQLPFQAAHPEFNDSLGAYGLVHVKFSVPGSGVFEQSIDGVRIRPWAPLRDHLQMDTGYRFLPHEGTGRGKAAWFTDDQ